MFPGLDQRGIAATGYVRKPEQARLLAEETTLNGLRQKLGQEIRENIGHGELSGLIVALATGDQQFIDTKQ